MAARRKPVEEPTTNRRQLVFRDPAALTSYERNARTHSPAQLRQIRDSIDTFGATNPILIDETGRIIAGHGRREAAMLQPALAEFPCIVITGLTAEQQRALVVLDNKIPLNAGWNDDLLREELLDLKGSGVDLKLLGFSVHELKGFLGEPKELSGVAGLGDNLQFQVIIDCADEGDQAAMLDRFKAEGRGCRPLTL